jgi:pyridoxamine 5'-phosphate oxidase
MPTSVADLRREYARARLDEANVSRDPITEFARWFEEAVKAEVQEPNAMTLASVSPDGAPSARIVLLKGFDERGFVFYSGYESRKGRELAQNPRGALCFYWDPLGRQVRIEGGVEPVTQEESEAYFRTRPRGNQISAWASAQSEPIASRSELEAAAREIERRYQGQEVPPRVGWGGYRLVPEIYEFWQHREDRLHDRLLYRRGPSGEWGLSRLAP